MATGVQVWSDTPVTNATADSNINWAEGMPPSQVDDSARAMMASVAKWRDDNNGTLLTSGSTTAFTVQTNQVESALTDGYTVKVQFAATNDLNATLAVDGLTAAPMQLIAGTNVPYGVFQNGAVQSFTYSTTGTGQWIANNYIIPQQVALTNGRTANAGGTSLSTSYTNVNLSLSLSTAHTYWVSAHLCLTDTVGAAVFVARLWDGVTTFDSGSVTCGAAGQFAHLSLGAICTPASTLAIQVLDSSRAVGGKTNASSASSGGFENMLQAVQIA